MKSLQHNGDKIYKSLKSLKKFTTKEAMKRFMIGFGICGLMSFAQASPLKCQLKNIANDTSTLKNEAKALPLIVQSIQSNNADNSLIQNISTLDSALGKLYILQLDFVLNQYQIRENILRGNISIKCQSCSDFAKSKIPFLFDENQAKEPTDNGIKEFLALDLSAKIGEEKLCDGLAKKDTKILLESYAHFALAGVNTRAVNVLLSAVKMGDRDAGMILGFLLENGIYLKQNKVASQMVKNATKSGKMESIFANNMVSKNFVVRDFDAHSNVLESMRYQNLIAIGVILSEQDNRYEGLSNEAKADIAKQINTELDKLKSIKQSLIAKMSASQKAQFNEALKLKQHLHNIDEKPYASTLVVK